MEKKPSHFFKVILRSSLEDKKLRIPDKFVMKFGNELSAVVTLKVPNGRVWQVGLISDGRKIWFCDGWHDFVQYHSIIAGYFLVFKYEKNSIFHVLIFDTSACEIHYPRTDEVPKNDKRNSVHQVEMDIEDSVEVMGLNNPNLPSTGLRNKASDECPTNGLSSKMYTPSVENQAKPSFGSVLGMSKDQNCATSLGNSSFKYSRETRSKMCKVEEVVVINNPNGIKESRKRKTNVNEMYNSQESLHCKGLLSKNADNFAASPSVQDMDLKADGTKLKKTRRNVEKNNHTEVVGTESQLKCVECKVGTHSSDRANKRIKFVENELLALLEDMGISITRRYGYLSAEERVRAINVAKYLKPKYPSFMISLRSTDIDNCRVYVPGKFAYKHFRKVAKCIKLQYSDGREWPIEITWYRSGCFIIKGWSAFLNDMNLQGGDICVFELVRMKNVLLKVSVFYVSKNEFE